MLNIINKNVIFPAYMCWNKDKRLQRLKEIEQRQWLSEDEIAAYQFGAFKKILAYAYSNVLFYQKLYAKNFVTPEDIKFPDDIKKLPVVTKKDLQAHYRDFISSSCSDSQGYKDASGGSTGRPTNFMGDWHSVYRKHAALLMTDKWSGWNIGEKSFYLWGADREVNKIRDSKEQFVQKYIYRHYLLNAFDITEEKMKEFTRQFLKYKPTLIVAYSNAASEFARYVMRENISGISPKGIICSAETLTDEKRALIKNTFSCRVLNRYGSREVGLIASECEAENGLHINASDVYVELIPIKKGTVGSEDCEVIVTDFNNHVMPFIRYNMEDMAFPVHKKCGCGRGLPMIGGITGRTSDFIVHINGSRIHGECFSHAFYGLSGISKFQIVQHAIDRIDVNIVPNECLKDSDTIIIMDKLQSILGTEIKVTIRIVGSIPIPESGKFKFAISHVTFA